MVKKSNPIEAVDLVPMNSELVRVLEAVEEKIGSDLKGVSIKAKRVSLPKAPSQDIDVQEPTGKILISIDTIKGGHAKRAGVLGHFAEKRWTVEGEIVDQIAISPFFLDRGGEEITETIAHEFLHLVASRSDIKDVSRQGTYHNKSFQALVDATSILESVEDKKIGCRTKLSEAGIAWLREEVRPDFGDISKILEPAPTSKPPTTVQFECEEDGNKATVSVRQYEEGFVPLCGHGHEPMLMNRIK